MGHQPMGGLAGQLLQLLHPDRPRRRCRRGSNTREDGEVVAQGGGAGQIVPGNRIGSQREGQIGRFLLKEGIGRRQRPHQGRQLARRRITGEKGPGEGHAFGLVMRFADSAVQLAHSGAKAATHVGIGGLAVIGNRVAGGHGNEATNVSTVIR
jgi:hypothetical protein